MRKQIVVCLGISWACLLLYAVGVLAQETKIQILEPSRDGVEVRKTYLVRGSASIPSGTHLWVLVRREDYEGLWWPQGDGKVDPANMEWKVSVTFGNKDDIGWNFDIGVILVAEQDHIILRDYRINAMKSKDWSPVEMPKVIGAPILMKVKKIGD